MTTLEGAQTDGSGAVVVHVPAKHRFEIRLADETVGFTEYTERGDHLVFTHTEVDEAHEGRGLAAHLVDETLADVRAAGKRAVAICPYMARYVQRHHAYEDIVDPPSSVSP